MSGKVFVDTNVLVYAHDLDAGEKCETARSLLRELWSSRSGVISTQVLQEFYVNVTRKIARPISFPEARGVLDAYAAWQVESILSPDILRASEVQERYQLSFWDALIVVAAVKGGAEALLTEDLQAGQLIEGVRVTQPFLQGT